MTETRQASVRLTDQSWHLLPDVRDLSLNKDGFLQLLDKENAPVAIYAPGTWKWVMLEDTPPKVIE